MSRRNKNQEPQPQMPQEINFDVSQQPNVMCTKCGYFAFMQVVTFKHVPALISPNGKEAAVPIPTYMCAQCGYIPPKMLAAPLVIPDGFTLDGEEPEEDTPESRIIQTSL